MDIHNYKQRLNSGIKRLKFSIEICEENKKFILGFIVLSLKTLLFPIIPFFETFFNQANR